MLLADPVSEEKQEPLVKRYVVTAEPEEAGEDNRGHCQSRIHRAFFVFCVIVH